MATARAPSLSVLLGNAKSALGMSQAGLGHAVTASRKTVGRWLAGSSSPTPGTVVEIARLVAPIDAALAVELARAVGATPEDAGVMMPAPAAAPAKAVSDVAIDAVVCAAADVAEATPKAMRPVLKAAFTRAQAVGLTVEQVVIGLTAKS